MVEVNFSCAGVRFDFNHSILVSWRCWYLFSAADLIFRRQYGNGVLARQVHTWRIWLVGSLLGMQSDCNDAQLCDNTLIQQSETQTDAQLCDNISRRRTQHKRAENTTQKNKRRGKWKVWPEAVYCKGRAAFPKGIDFWINSKRPLTPPLNFKKSCCNFIKFHVQKALFKSPNSARQIFGLKLIPPYLDRVPIWLWKSQMGERRG